MSDTLEIYGYTFPDLVWDIMSYYSDMSIKSKFVRKEYGVNPDIGCKVPLDFCEFSRNKYTNLEHNNIIIQPNLISKISNILWENGLLRKIRIAINDFDGEMGEAFFRPNPLDIENKKYISSHLNNIVYGFKYIFNTNKNNVLPVIVEKNGDSMVGTCFLSIFGIVTAKHCLKVDKVQIGKGSTLIPPEMLQHTQIYALENYDIAVIPIEQKVIEKNIPFTFGEPEVLDEIITMGYPKHGGFDNFITTTVGSIAAIENSYIYKHDLMLLSSRIRGGNSGGPVVNRKGQVVGIITDFPCSEESEPKNGLSEYDKFGYGLALPFKYIVETYDSKTPFVNHIQFVDDL